MVYEGAPWSVRLAAELVLWKCRVPHSSPWAPYIGSLPRIAPSPVTTFDWAAIKELHYAPIQEALAELAWLITDSTQQMTAKGFLISDHEREVFEWALGLVHSRTFANSSKEGGLGVRMLVPFMDLINHAGDVEQGLPPNTSIRGTDNCEWKLRPPAKGETGWWMELWARQPIAQGEELCFSYGERNNDDFLLHYGFVPPRNPHDDFVLFELAEEAAMWLSENSPVPSPEALRAVGIMEEVYKEPPPEVARYGTDKDRARLRAFRGARVDPRLRALFQVALRDDPQQADAFIALRCKQLLEAAPTSLTADLWWLEDVAAPEHCIGDLLAYYSHIGFDWAQAEDPTALPRKPSAAAVLAVTYRAYKKMILVDYLVSRRTPAL